MVFGDRRGEGEEKSQIRGWGDDEQCRSWVFDVRIYEYNLRGDWFSVLSWLEELNERFLQGKEGRTEV